jgi:hypothetical protein
MDSFDDLSKQEAIVDDSGMLAFFEHFSLPQRDLS